MNAVAGGSDVSAAGEVLDLHDCNHFSSFILHPSPALPGKLVGLTYRPSRECVVNQIMVPCAEGFVQQAVNGYKQTLLF
jgi:hypothetical protein